MKDKNIIDSKNIQNISNFLSIILIGGGLLILIFSNIIGSFFLQSAGLHPVHHFSELGNNFQFFLLNYTFFFCIPFLYGVLIFYFDYMAKREADFKYHFFASIKLNRSALYFACIFITPFFIMMSISFYIMEFYSKISEIYIAYHVLIFFPVLLSVFCSYVYIKHRMRQEGPSPILLYPFFPFSAESEKKRLNIQASMPFIFANVFSLFLPFYVAVFFFRVDHISFFNIEKDFFAITILNYLLLITFRIIGYWHGIIKSMTMYSISSFLLVIILFFSYDSLRILVIENIYKPTNATVSCNGFKIPNDGLPIKYIELKSFYIVYYFKFEKGHVSTSDVRYFRKDSECEIRKNTTVFKMLPLE